MPLVWPPGLPQTPELSWTAQLPQTTIRTKTDTGPAKIRPRYTAGVIDFKSVSILLDEYQRDELETFYSTTTGGGSLSFEWQRPDTGATVEFRFKGNPPSYQPINHRTYRATFDLEVLP